ncbi:MAG: hypothetical protein GY754_07105 [bacterium]|nr:hypothetical protein [bacterium]
MKMKKSLCFFFITCFILLLSCADSGWEDDPSGVTAVTAALNFPDGSTISGHDIIIITFSDSMNTSSVSLSGSMGDVVADGNMVWTKNSFDNDTLTLTPNSDGGPSYLWPLGNSSLIIEGKSSDGTDMEKASLSYTVENKVTATPNFADGSTISRHDIIIITFNSSMNTSSVSLTGSMGDVVAAVNMVWTKKSFDNDTLTLTPNSDGGPSYLWPQGNSSLIIEGSSSDGTEMEKASLSYTVENKVTATLNFADGSTISGHDIIIITFSDSMNTSSVSLTGSMGTVAADGNMPWTKTTAVNDTLTLTPNPDGGPVNVWPQGSSSLIIEGKSSDGTDMEKASLSYIVENVVYVRGTDGDDMNYPGTASKPKATVQAGIDLADTLYTTGSVRVAQGTYTANYYTAGTPVAEMKEGISVYGGYSVQNWEWRNSSNYETVLEDTSEGGGSEDAPNRAVNASSAITTSTTIDGFTIILGKDNGTDSAANAAVYCEGSPTIQNNNISGRTQNLAGRFSYGILSNSASASPYIYNNTIDPGYNVNSGASYGIRNNYVNAVTITNNTIHGGSGNTTYGIRNNDGDSIISSNTIYGGIWSTAGYCIYVRNSNPSISGNTFNSSHAALTQTYSIWEANTTSDPAAVQNNHFNYSGYWYQDEGSSGTLVQNSLYITISIEGSSDTLASWGNYSNF